MSCYITPVIDAIDGRKPSYTINDDKGTIFIPIGKKYKTKAQTFRVAQRLHNKIGDLFGKYEKENAIMASLESREDGTILNITPTPLFKKAMDLVYEIRQQNENERKVRESLRQRQIEGNWFETEEGDIIPIWDADLRIYDSVNIKDSNSSKEPEKINILGSQADTQGFKNLVSDQNNISQERLKVIQEIFNSNPELSKVGDVFSYAIYLDTIFPDGKVTEIDDSLYISVLNQLEQENTIEKDCTGKGKLKAEKGLQTNFNRGGKWKLIRDLKGYPTHKEGGVDLTIGKNGVSIRNGNTEFTAKHGLVIPKN